MREIKFRGRTSKGEWLYGDLQQWSNGDVYIGTQNEAWTDDGFPHTDDYLSITKVNENTVGQFTGLHDKNGKEIYEGDIFHIGDPNLMHEVVWHDTGFIGKQIGCYGSYIGLEHWADRIEVIGNIHDNPELLKGGEK